MQESPHDRLSEATTSSLFPFEQRLERMLTRFHPPFSARLRLVRHAFELALEIMWITDDPLHEAPNASRVDPRSPAVACVLFRNRASRISGSACSLRTRDTGGSADPTRRR